MSRNIKPAKLEDLSSMTFLGRVPPEAPPLDPVEVVARFQIETDTALAIIRKEHRQGIVALETRVAALVDEWIRTRDTVSELRRTVEDALHQMRKGIEEAINAQRESMAAAQKAQTAAAVFDKLKASQPDFHRMVNDQNKTVASMRDAMTLLEEQVRGYAKRLDELDAVAVDYEDTKGAVRGLDIVVKDLNSEARQRRQVGGRSS